MVEIIRLISDSWSCVVFSTGEKSKGPSIFKAALAVDPAKFIKRLTRRTILCGLTELNVPKECYGPLPFSKFLLTVTPITVPHSTRSPPCGV